MRIILSREGQMFNKFQLWSSNIKVVEGNSDDGLKLDMTQTMVTFYKE